MAESESLERSLQKMHVQQMEVCKVGTLHTGSGMLRVFAGGVSDLELQGWEPCAALPHGCSGAPSRLVRLVPFSMTDHGSEEGTPCCGSHLQSWLAAICLLGLHL
jgi:hypothetical protein